MSVIKRNELLHFTRPERRAEVLHLDPDARAELVESAIGAFCSEASKERRDEMLSLVQTILDNDPSISSRFTTIAYIVCNRHLMITTVNQQWLNRSQVSADLVYGKVLYEQRDYLDTEIEQMYSMVMETRLIADAIVRYKNEEKGYDGWFALVVIPLEEGGIGVLSKFAATKEELLDPAQDLTAPDAPRVISLS